MESGSSEGLCVKKARVEQPMDSQISGHVLKPTGQSRHSGAKQPEQSAIGIPELRDEKELKAIFPDDVELQLTRVRLLQLVETRRARKGQRVLILTQPFCKAKNARAWESNCCKAIKECIRMHLYTYNMLTQYLFLYPVSLHMLLFPGVLCSFKSIVFRASRQSGPTAERRASGSSARLPVDNPDHPGPLAVISVS